MSVSLSPHRVRASIMILEDNKPNISKPTNKSGNSGIQSNLHPRTIWEMRAIFAHEQFGKFEYPEGHPSVITHVSDRRNIQLLKNGIHPQGTPGWQLSLMSTGHRAPWTSNSGPRRTPCQPAHGHLGPQDMWHPNPTWGHLAHGQAGHPVLPSEHKEDTCQEGRTPPPQDTWSASSWTEDTSSRDT